jgi:hypothetical protein
MASLLIGQPIARLRGTLKAVHQEAGVTDRTLYSVLKKYADMLMKELDQKGKLLGFSAVFETLNWVELEEVDKIEASCMCLKSYSTFRRTVLPMPIFREGAYGPMVRSITSLDGATSVTMTTLDQYNILSKSKNFRYNKEKYAWYLNDRLYFPNVDWPACRIEGIFEDEIWMFNCGQDRCVIRQEQSLNIPDYLLAKIEQMAMQELMGRLQVPVDSIQDGVNINK